MPTNDLMQFTSVDLINLRRWYKKAPRQFAAATGMLLNNFAFGSRHGAIEMIHRGMVVRSPGFVHSSIVVKKSHFRPPIDSQVSMMGSIRRPRFTGWRAQELGPRKIRKHYAALPGRGKKKIGKIKRSYRLDKPFITPDRFPKRRGFKGRNRNHLISIMLAQLDRMNYSKPFVITGHSSLPSGLYQFGQGRTGYDQRELEVLQIFGKPKRTRRVKWMSGGVRLYFGRISLKREWGRVVDRVLQRGRMR